MKALAALALFLASFAQDVEATKPAPRDDKWVKRHDGFNEIAKKGGVDFLLMGDSITDGWRGGGKKVYAEHFDALKPANFGIGGDRTQHVLWRLQNGELDGITPKVCMLMIGTNNGKDSDVDVAAGITAIIRRSRRSRRRRRSCCWRSSPAARSPTPGARRTTGSTRWWRSSTTAARR